MGLSIWVLGLGYGVAMAVLVVGCPFVDELWRVCGGLPIWVLGGNGGVLG